MAALAAALQLILNKIVAWAGWLLQVFLQVFKDLWEFLTDGFVWVFEQFVDLVIMILQGASELPGWSSVSTAVGWLGSIPADMLNILGLLHFGTCMAIIGGALMIRFVLGLIPFVRVGG